MGYLELVKKLLTCLDVLGAGTLDNVCKVLQGFPSHPKLLATLIGPKLNFEDMEQLYFH